MSIPESERQAPVCPKTVRRHRPNPSSVMGDGRLRCLTKGIRTPSKGLGCCGVHSWSLPGHQVDRSGLGEEAWSHLIRFGFFLPPKSPLLSGLCIGMLFLDRSKTLLTVPPLNIKIFPRKLEQLRYKTQESARNKMYDFIEFSAISQRNFSQNTTKFFQGFSTKR